MCKDQSRSKAHVKNIVNGKKEFQKNMKTDKTEFGKK